MNESVADKLGWCGCGDHASIDAMMLDYLSSLEAVPDGDWPDPDVAPPERTLLAYIADSLSWTEHGTSIRYPWLTDEGRRMLAVLRGEGSSVAVGGSMGPLPPGLIVGESGPEGGSG
jgi:hypothetical protein